MKKTTFLLLFLSFSSLFLHAQEVNKKLIPRLTLANVSSGGNISYGQIVADPRLEDVTAQVTVQGFSISFVPKGKDVYGPYVIKGTSLTNKEIAILKKLKGVATKIVVEDIKVKTSDGMIRSFADGEFNYR